MSYKRAEEILPMDVLELIWKYIDGENIYIPRKEDNRKQWGKTTGIRQELQEKNAAIYQDFQNGCKIRVLAEKYFLSEKSVQRIIREMKKAE